MCVQNRRFLMYLKFAIFSDRLIAPFAISSRRGVRSVRYIGIVIFMSSNIHLCWWLAREWQVQQPLWPVQLVHHSILLAWRHLTTPNPLPLPLTNTTLGWSNTTLRLLSVKRKRNKQFQKAKTYSLKPHSYVGLQMAATNQIWEKTDKY